MAAVVSSLAVLSPLGLSVGWLSLEFAVLEAVSDLVSDLPSDLVFDLPSLWAVASDDAAFVALLSLAEPLFDDAVLWLRDESEFDALALLLLERCDGSCCCVEDGEDDEGAEVAGSAGITASTNAAKLSLACEESGLADFGAVV